MSTNLMDLASRIFLAVTTLRRRIKRGTAITGDEVSEEISQIFREQDQRCEGDSGLHSAWQHARKPLAYLVDEIMMNTEWEYRGWWADNSLEVRLLGHPQKMRGIRFFDELEIARRQVEQGDSASGPQKKRTVDLLTVFYVCLKLGFEGKYAGQTRELEREAQSILNLLPVSSRTPSREFFANAYRHTIEIPPNYETVMRLAKTVGALVGMVLIFFGIRAFLGNRLLDDLQAAQQAVGNFFSANT